jgi:imidazolonepropionase-like amidohydrolase
MSTLSLCIALVLAGGREAQAQKPPAKSDRPLAIRADKVYLGDGSVIDQGVILIDGGVIRAVGAGVEIPENASVIDHKGVASAGLIALHAYSGSPSEMRDSTRTVMPEAQIAHVFNPEHYDFSDALKAGITSLVLTPTPQSLVGGIGAVVKTASGRILSKDAELSLGFSAECLSRNRFPTSYSGAMTELEHRFDKPEGNFSKAASGKLPVFFEADSREDVLRAIDFAERHKLIGAINGAEWAGEVAEGIKASKLSVIAGPLDVGEQRRTIKSVIALAEAGIPFGFGLDSPWRHPATLRLEAAMCMREGLAHGAAWKALTSNAAQIAGVADHVGRLERGLDADVVLWSGDPLDLSSAVKAVFIDGERVYGAEK